MKEPEKFLKGCAQAQVDHLHTVLDGPIEPGGKLNGAPAHVPSQHAHAVDLRFGREGVDDACAGGPMSGDVGWFVIQLDAVLVFCSGIVFCDQAGRTISSDIYRNLKGDESVFRRPANTFNIWTQAFRSASPSALI